jgi:hypothetical protein
MLLTIYNTTSPSHITTHNVTIPDHLSCVLAEYHIVNSTPASNSTTSWPWVVKLSSIVLLFDTDSAFVKWLTFLANCLPHAPPLSVGASGCSEAGYSNGNDCCI